jgi:hypothetical protein
LYPATTRHQLNAQLFYDDPPEQRAKVAQNTVALDIDDDDDDFLPLRRLEGAASSSSSDYSSSSEDDEESRRPKIDQRQDQRVLSQYHGLVKDGDFQHAKWTGMCA